MPRPRPEHIGFLLILLGYLLAGALFAIYTPRWQAPDEPAHYNTVRQVAEKGCCPIIESGDWDQDALSVLTTAKFAPDTLSDFDSIQYEDHQPPLYYLLASIVFKLSAGDLLALRLLSVVIGAGVVALSYSISRRLLPGQPQIALGVMALVAFLPQHLHMLSAVNNDALAELIVALALLRLLRCLESPSRPMWRLGLLVGLAFLTKLTIYFLALLAPLAIWLSWRRGSEPLDALLRRLTIFALAAGVIGGAWWLRNLSVYGYPDFLGLAAHDQVVADQARTDDFIAASGALPALTQLLGTTFKSFWGQFGWMALPLDNVLGGWIYRGFGLLMIAGVSGALLAGRRGKVSAKRWLLLLLAIAAVLLQFAYYNLEFVQWQGRYLFPALIPIAFILVFGVDYWRVRLSGPWSVARWLTPIGMAGLFALDIYLLFRVIAPGLAPA